MFLRRGVWEELGGWEERFDFPGGGLLNLDTYGRAIELPGAAFVSLLGEGTFHQLHGGIAANAPLDNFHANWDDWHGQYREIRGRDFRPAFPKTPPTFIGTLPRPALSHFLREALVPTPDIPPHLGDRFDRELWALEPPVGSETPVTAALIGLMHTEFRAGRWTAAEVRMSLTSIAFFYGLVGGHHRTLTFTRAHKNRPRRIHHRISAAHLLCRKTPTGQGCHP
jgi:hypothetical protein